MSLWRVGETAEYLGIRPKTLYEWVRTGRVPHRKLGFNVRFDPDEIERWASSQSSTRTGATGPGVEELEAAALAAAERLRRLETDVGAEFSFPKRQALKDLATRLEKAVEAITDC